MPRTSQPRSIEELEALVAQQQMALEAKEAELEQRQAMIEERDALIAFYREWKRLIDSQRFGAKSERFASDAQARLFDEAEAIVAEQTTADEEAVSIPAHTRRKRRPRALPDFLPVHEILHDLSEEEKVCPHHASHRLVEIGR